MTVRLIGSRLCADCSFADDHRLAADPNLLENSCPARERNVNTTRAAPIRTPCEAHEPRGSVGRHSVVPEEICAQRSTRAAGGRILWNTEDGREHSTVDRGIIVGRLGENMNTGSCSRSTSRSNVRNLVRSTDAVSTAARRI